MRRAFELALAIVLVIPGLVFLSNAGDLRQYSSPSAPPGQFLYALSRGVGLYALTFIWLQVLLGAFRSMAGSWLGSRDVMRTHRALGVSAALAAVAHVGLFLAAVALRSDGASSLELLAPRVGAGYYRRMLALGALGLYALLVTWGATSLRRRPSMQAIWKRFHWLGYAALLLVLVHSAAIGSETRLEPQRALYALYFATATGALLWARSPGLRQRMRVRRSAAGS